MNGAINKTEISAELLQDAYSKVDNIVTKNYMHNLADYSVIQPPTTIKAQKCSHFLALSKIEKLVFNKEERMLDKLSSIYLSVLENNGSLVFVIESQVGKNDFTGGNEYCVKLYLGTRGEDNLHSNYCKEALERSFLGNFPGSELAPVAKEDIDKLSDALFDSNIPKIVSSVSGVASLRDTDKDKFVQGIEKLIDAMQGKAYTAIFIADPISYQQIIQIRSGYEQLYSQLVPFAQSDINIGFNESSSFTNSLSESFSNSVSQSLTDTQSYTKGTSESSGATINYGRNIVTSAFVSVFGGKSGRSENISVSANESTSNSQANTRGTVDSQTKQTGESDTVSKGKSQSIQLKFQNKAVKNLIEKIDEQLQRLKKSEDLGMWNCAAYFIADDKKTAITAASTYKALMRGENSSVESSCINTWDKENDNYPNLTGYIKKCRHPLITIPSGGNESFTATPGSLVSGNELALHFGLPLKSISGLSVLECAEFGRNIATYDKIDSRKRIHLGKIFHMGSTEESTVNIDINSLAMHSFITGATGSGKSNAVYQLIDKLHDHGVKFLIIEPAKGEYKNVFGGRENVYVFGTNPAYSSLIKLNPFSFNENIHILEHIDKLVEIFNACWPMYAAMPAVLKDAIEQIYVNKGWDLNESLNYSGKNRVPGFADLLFTLPNVIKNSDYSDEMKGNYIGALVTRIKSLTNGIYGEIFTEDEIPDDVLFNQDCIVDLSRVSSSETKALIMGILVMKMHEHRSSSALANSMNQSLNHVTILEEAHNLLRKTSGEQSPDGANIQGKAVEMIANAIAEMRTFGEGFIIVDQSPGLMDMSVIRNTNMKVILRLPDESDRILVGKSANLNNEQIVELAKLKVGVAAIYQNNWLQPVLCQIEPFKNEQAYTFKKGESPKQYHRKMNGYVIKLLFAKRYGLSSGDSKLYSPKLITELTHWVAGLRVGEEIKKELITNLEQYSRQQTMALWDQENFAGLSKIVFALFPSREILKRSVQTSNFEEWNNITVNSIRMFAECNNIALYEYGIIQCLLRNQALIDEESKKFYFQWAECVGKGLQI